MATERVTAEEVEALATKIKHCRPPFGGRAAALLAAQQAEIERLRGALERVVEHGTRRIVERVGDMYDLTGGYVEHEETSTEAEIARAALAPPPREGETGRAEQGGDHD